MKQTTMNPIAKLYANHGNEITALWLSKTFIAYIKYSILLSTNIFITLHYGQEMVNFSVVGVGKKNKAHGFPNTISIDQHVIRAR